MDVLDPRISTAIGTAVVILLFMMPILMYVDRLKVKSIKSDLKDELTRELSSQKDKDDSTLRRMLEDIIEKNILKVSQEMRDLFDLKHDNTLERLRLMEITFSERMAKIEGRVDATERDINNIAGAMRG